MNIKNIITQVCPLIKKQVYNDYGNKTIVIGEGHIYSTLLIIGEAMGAQEEKLRRIFIGRSGNILREALSNNGIESFFLINTLPIRPQNNRTPTKDEIITFSQFTRCFIQQKQFKYVLPLGTCAKFLLYHLKINTPYKTWHPAYLLYSNSSSVKTQFHNTFKQLSNDIKLTQQKHNMLKIEYEIFTTTC